MVYAKSRYARRLSLVLIGILLVSLLVSLVQLRSVKPTKASVLTGSATLNLDSGWQLQSSAKATQAGSSISTTSFSPAGWYPVTVPSTVIGGLIQNGVYQDPFYSKNF